MIVEPFNFCFGKICLAELVKKDSFTIKHRRGHHEEAVLIADLIDTNLFKNYRCEHVRKDGFIYFNFRRQA